MFAFKYRVIEVVREETKTQSGEHIIRTIGYDDIRDAEERMKTMKPKENGKLVIEKVLFY